MLLKAFFSGLIFVSFICNITPGQTDSSNQRLPDKPLIYPLTPRSYFSLFGKDCKGIIVAPAKIRKNQILGIGIFAGITSALFVIDPSVDSYVRKLEDRNRNIQPAGHFISKFGERYAAIPVGAIYLYALIRNDKKLKTTTWLATQAIMTSGALTWVEKFITSRERPSFAYTHGSYNRGGIWHGLWGYIDNYTDTKSPPGAGYDAFPSGHTSLAFSIATVYAKMYKDQPVVPVIAYTAATLIGLSRLTEHAHWISDVFVGAVLGYVCGDQAVRNYRRSCILKSRKSLFNNLSYSMDYSNGKILIGSRLKL